MDTLHVVSETALITLKSRVIESQKDPPLIQDKMSEECLNRITPLIPEDVANRVLQRTLPSSLTQHIAIRSRQYDRYTQAFLSEYQDGLVVSLGSGFDTRFWRISEEAWPYVEIDLPEVIEAKRQVLGDVISYKMIGSSVLAEEWTHEIASMQNEQVLFLAEGLFMYLPPTDVMAVFRRLAETFSRSMIVFEVVHKKYTQGLWKKMVESKMEGSLGTEAGTSYRFGVQEAQDVEAYGPGIKVVEEWSYFEDADLRPKFLQWFKHIKLFARTQWTIKATIGA